MTPGAYSGANPPFAGAPTLTPTLWSVTISGARIFIPAPLNVNCPSATGSGTVNGVLNAILAQGADVTLGAIGLGSSNDFHKPFAKDKRVGGAPVRLDASRAIRADVGRAVLTDRDTGM